MTMEWEDNTFEKNAGIEEHHQEQDQNNTWNV